MPDKEIKHGQCEIQFGRCEFKLDSNCWKEINKAFEYDRKGYGEWVGSELFNSLEKYYKNPYITSMKERFGDESKVEFMGNQVFGNESYRTNAILDLRDKLKIPELSEEIMWDIACEAAIKFNKEYDVK